MCSKDSYDYMQGADDAKEKIHKVAGHTPAYYDGYDTTYKAMRQVRKMRAEK